MASKYVCEVWAGTQEVMNFGVGNQSMEAAKENVIRMLPGLAKSKGVDLAQITAIVICGNDYTDQVLTVFKKKNIIK